MLAAARPSLGQGPGLPGFGSPALLFLAIAGAIAVVANGVAILRVRVWNPSRELQLQTAEDEDVFVRDASAATAVRSPHAAAQKTRPVWDNPIFVARGALNKWPQSAGNPAGVFSRWPLSSLWALHAAVAEGIAVLAGR